MLVFARVAVNDCKIEVHYPIWRIRSYYTIFWMMLEAPTLSNIEGKHHKKIQDGLFRDTTHRQTNHFTIRYLEKVSNEHGWQIFFIHCLLSFSVVQPGYIRINIRSKHIFKHPRFNIELRQYICVLSNQVKGYEWDSFTEICTNSLWTKPLELITLDVFLYFPPFRKEELSTVLIGLSPIEDKASQTAEDHNDLQFVLAVYNKWWNTRWHWQ